MMMMMMDEGARRKETFCIIMEHTTYLEHLQLVQDG